MSSESQEVPFPASDTQAWRIRHVEQLLRALDGVDSIKIVPEENGGIQEIHVVTGSQIGAKQIVRNIESALLAELGLQVDHRKISVARFKERDLEEVRGEISGEAVAREAARRLVLTSIQIDRRAGREIVCRVELTEEDEAFLGEASGMDHARSRLEVAGEAALEAVRSGARTEVSLVLEGIRETKVLGHNVVVALIQARTGRSRTPLTGVGRVDDSIEEAAVISILHATNRWIATRRRREEEDGADET